MHGKIFVYGNDEMLVMTRRMILEKMGYCVYTAVNFSNALFVLMNHEINVLVLCQSLKDEDILERARALQPEMKCVAVECEELPGLEGVDIVRGPLGPKSLLYTIGSLLVQETSAQS
jgi:DNA-binding response OmpR family regulator